LVDLKRGELISCGPADKEFGEVGFSTSCSPRTKKDFDLAMSLLHSFEYDEAEKVFARVIDAEPECAMAYWGVAMSNYHQLWAPPAAVELKKGADAIAIAQAIKEVSTREAAFINSMAIFYKDWEKTDHQTRLNNYLAALEKNYKELPDDKEAAIFYALTLTASADPQDQEFIRQKKAAEILNALYPGQPDHPGIIHYIIHSYDSPELAPLALPAARKYASIAPSSAHAQHMPSHIFTRLGLWEESIRSNLVSTASAKCYAEGTGIKGHWDEELHGMDYLVYAYLQKGDNKNAKRQFDYLRTINEVFPLNFKVAYAYASIPARYYLENKMWNEAASMQLHPADFPWDKYPWQKGIYHFGRLLGLIHLDQVDSATAELKQLERIHEELISQKDMYKAGQVMIQKLASEAWILFKQGKRNEALRKMETAAEMEDRTQKHAVTPGEVIPARELLADMQLEMNRPEMALSTYEQDLKDRPNRFNGLYHAALAAERTKNLDKAIHYYKQLVDVSGTVASDRPELELARQFLRKQKLNGY
jgi:tetratricopeptide (TPR) repeat protein